MYRKERSREITNRNTRSKGKVRWALFLIAFIRFYPIISKVKSFQAVSYYAAFCIHFSFLIPRDRFLPLRISIFNLAADVLTFEQVNAIQADLDHAKERSRRLY